MQRKEEPSPTPFWESVALASPEWGGRCLLDSYRLVRRIQNGCEQTQEMCRQQRKLIAEQREFLKGLRHAFAPDARGGANVSAGGKPERESDGGARAVE